MSVKSILKWAVVAFVIWWVVEQPGNASHLLTSAVGLLNTVATGFAHFVSTTV